MRSAARRSIVDSDHEHGAVIIGKAASECLHDSERVLPVGAVRLKTRHEDDCARRELEAFARRDDIR